MKRANVIIRERWEGLSVLHLQSNVLVFFFFAYQKENAIRKLRKFRLGSIMPSAATGLKQGPVPFTVTACSM